jgi:hypothetical protein
MKTAENSVDCITGLVTVKLGQKMLDEHRCRGWLCFLSENINEGEIVPGGFRTLARTNYTKRTINA